MTSENLRWDMLAIKASDVLAIDVQTIRASFDFIDAMYHLERMPGMDAMGCAILSKKLVALVDGCHDSRPPRKLRKCQIRRITKRRQVARKGHA